jgi:hypothetical protein
MNIADKAWLHGDMGMMDVTYETRYATLLTFGFAMTIGTFCSVYRNIIDEGRTKAERVTKSSIIAAAFSYSFVGLIEGFATLNPFSWTGAIRHFSIAMNVAFSQYTKEDYAQVVRAKAKLREGQDNIKIKSFDTKIKVSNAENQAVYNLIRFPLKILDLSNFEIGGVPIGKIAYYGSLPFVRLYNSYWIEKRYISMLEEMARNPKPEKARAIVRIEEIMTQIDIAWSRMATAGIYATLPVMKLLNVIWFNNRLEHFEAATSIDPSPRNQVKLSNWRKRVEAINQAWGNIKSLPQTIPEQLGSIPQRLRDAKQSYQEWKLKPKPTHCALTFKNMSQSEINSIFKE